MTAQPPPDRYPGTPGWVKALAVIAVVLALLIGLVLVTGLGGPHGPQRHGGALQSGASRAASGW
jgi:hypothetical protein